MAKTTRHPTTTCPGCGAALSASVAPMDPDAAPGTEDLSVCLHCAQPFRYREGLTLEVLTMEDVVAMDRKEPGLLAKVEALIKAVEERDEDYGEGRSPPMS